MKNKIELKTSLPKTIYTDIVGLADPMLLGVTIRYYNYSDNTLYMQIIGGGTYWNNHTVNLGSLGSGNSTYANLDNFLSRAVPATARNETINLTLKAYTDVNYTALAYTFTRTVDVIFIKSNDSSWTTDFADNFDDSTVMNWTSYKEYGQDCSILEPLKTTSTYAISSPNSLYSHLYGDPAQHTCHLITGEYQQSIYKTFALPNRDTIYAVFNLRFASGHLPFVDIYTDACGFQYLKIKANNTDILMQLGYLSNSAYEIIPRNRWIRIVVPLSSYKNAATELRVFLDVYFRDGQPICEYSTLSIIFLDDFRIISK